jgi:hypothetical protein
MTAATAPSAEATEAPSAPIKGVEDLLKNVTVQIDGVTYVASDIKKMRWAQKLYLETIFMEAGLEDPRRLIVRDTAWEQNVKQLLLALYRSGRTFDFVAGALVRTGEKWTEQDARVLALRLADLDDEEMTARLQQLIAVFIAGFFMRGLSSLGTSPSASTRTTAPSEPSPNAAPTSLADGAPSSADSLATTATG